MHACTSNTIPASGSDGRAMIRFIALIGWRRLWRKESRDVSLIREGFPSLASMNLAATPVPIFAAQIPNATRVRPAAYTYNITLNSTINVHTCIPKGYSQCSSRTIPLKCWQLQYNKMSIPHSKCRINDHVHVRVHCTCTCVATSPTSTQMKPYLHDCGFLLHVHVHCIRMYMHVHVLTVAETLSQSVTKLLTPSPINTPAALHESNKIVEKLQLPTRSQELWQ